MKRPVLVVILTLCAAAAVRGDQPLAREAFRSPQTSLFGADNLTFDRTDSPAPFDRLLRLSPHVPVASGEVFIGPNERGTLEDTVWLRLECLDETLPGAMGSLSVVAFEDDGPQLRITRRSLRREAALEWFNGTRWHPTGTVIDLDDDYRLRTVMDLDAGTMDVYLRRRVGGNEMPVILGETFRAFSAKEVRRRFAVGRPSGMKVSLAAWQLWRGGRGEFLKTDVPTGRDDVLVMRYAAEVRLDGDAVRSEGTGGSIGYALKRARGFRDDMELPDISGWRPQRLVQRQTNFRRSGKWSLALSEGVGPVEHELTIPHADFDVKLSFLIPKELDRNRQVYLVRLKDLETRAEPVGPSVYLDYGAGTDGRSLLILQQRPSEYHSEEVDVQPGKWYGLSLRTSRAYATYTAKFVDADGKEKALNGGKPVKFFLGTAIGERVCWRFFTIVAMRPGQTDLRKLEITSLPRCVDVIYDPKQRKKLVGLQLRGLKEDKLKGVNLNDPKQLWRVAAGGEVIDKQWPSLRFDKKDAAKLKDYRLFRLSGHVHLPWPVQGFACSANGTLLFNAWWTSSGLGGVMNGKPGQWKPLKVDPKRRKVGTTAVHMIYLRPKPDAKPYAELHWVLPGKTPAEHEPIPGELFFGRDVTLVRPVLKDSGIGAALVDGKLHLIEGRAGLGIYDRRMRREKFLRAPFRPFLKSPSYDVKGFVWDRWAGCYWVLSKSTRLLYRLDRSFKLIGPSSRWGRDGTLAAAGPERLYFIDAKGQLMLTDRFLSVRKSMPLEKMFGGTPMFSAAEFARGYLYVATRADSPVYPNSIICIDTRYWNPIFRIDVAESFPDVTSMTSDDETMVLLSREHACIGVFKLPAREKIAPQTTFLCVDDLSLKPVLTAADVDLIPGPEGKLSGWKRKKPFKPNPAGKGFILQNYRTPATYEKSHIAYVGLQKSQYEYLKLRTLDPKNVGRLYVDVRTAAGPVFRRILIAYGPRRTFDKRYPDLLGKTHAFDEFARRRDAQSTMSKLYLHRHLNGPFEGVDLKLVRLLPIGEGHNQHVFNLEKELGIRPGDSINGIVLRYGGQCPPILSLSLSPSRHIVRDEAEGWVESNPVELEGGHRRLEWVSWDEKPFDGARGHLRVEVRTASDKYFIDAAPWLPVANAQRLALPPAGYLQWRATMSTKDPWRPPMLSAMAFGFASTEPAGRVSGRAWGPQWPWLLLMVPLAAAIAWFLIGRKAWWTCRRHAR